MLTDYVTELLKDGKWHYVHTIARRLSQPEGRIKDILKFCADYNIVVFDKTGNRIRIDETFKKIFD